MAEGMMLYEQDTELQLLIRLLEPLQNKIVLDVGAERGGFVEAFLTQGCPTIFAFEPYPPNVAVLRQKFGNTALVKIYDQAIGIQDGTVTLHIAEDKTAAGNNSAYHSLIASSDTPTIHWAGEISVQCRSLHSLMLEGVIPAQVGIVKIDTEGNDFAVLQGMGNLISSVVMIEYGNDLLDTVGTSQYDLVDVAKFMKERGYSNFVFIKRHDEFEILQVNSVYSRPGDWGNVIFIHDSVFPQLYSIVDEQAAVAQSTLIDKALDFRIQAQRRLEIIEQQRQATSVKRSHPNQSVSSNGSQLYTREQVDQLLAAQKSLPTRLIEYLNHKFIATKMWILPPPKLGVFFQHSPAPMRIPAGYAKPVKQTALPTISIVTPSYNQGRFLKSTIESILTQNYPRLEYIVQDSASTDETQQILQRYSSQLKYESVKDKGQSNAINLGFAKTSGQIMAYLNSDDLLLPGSLNYVADFFATHPDVDVVYGHRIVIDEAGQELGRWVLPPHDDEVLSWADYVPQETLFWRRQIWERVGSQVDETFRFAMDWDLILRFRDAGAHFARLPRFLGAFRVHAQQKTSTQMNDIGAQEMSRLRERVLRRSVTHSEINRHLIPYFRRHRILNRLYSLGILRF